MVEYLIFTNNCTFRQEAETPQKAIELFIERVRNRGIESRTKIPAEREISLSLTEALANETLMLIIVSATEDRPRTLLGGFQRNQFVESVDKELAKAVRRKLTDLEFRSVRD